MRHRSRAVALALSTGALVSAGAPAPVTSEVVVVATGLRNTQGLVRACMTGDARLFPKCRNATAAYSTTGEAAGIVTLVFRDVKPGRYAIALLHDENRNGKADRAGGMVPIEGFGFSRDARVRFGPPKFAEAAFEVPSGAHERLTIKMRYML